MTPSPQGVHLCSYTKYPITPAFKKTPSGEYAIHLEGLPMATARLTPEEAESIGRQLIQASIEARQFALQDQDDLKEVV